MLAVKAHYMLYSLKLAALSGYRVLSMHFNTYVFIQQNILNDLLHQSSMGTVLEGRHVAWWACSDCFPLFMQAHTSCNP